MKDKADMGMWLDSVIHGGLITTAQMAIDYTTLVLRGRFGEEKLQEQLPLIAYDEGDTWRVDGSYTLPGREPGTLAFFMLIQKYDGKVLDLGHLLPRDVPDHVKAIIEEAKKRAPD